MEGGIEIQINLHLLREDIRIAEEAELKRTTPQPWLRLDVPSEFSNFGYLPIETAIELESTRGSFFQCQCIVGHTCRVNHRFPLPVCLPHYIAAVFVS